MREREKREGRERKKREGRASAWERKIECKLNVLTNENRASLNRQKRNLE